MKRLTVLAAAMAVATAAPLLAGSDADDPRTETVHMVKPGETLGGIANRTGVARVLIIEANALQPPYAVQAGQKLIIPRRQTYTVKKGDTTFAVAMEHGVPWPKIAAASNLDAKAAIKPGQVLNIPTLVKARPDAAESATRAPRTAAAAEPAKAVVAPASAGGMAKLPPDTAAPRMIWPLKGDLRRGFIARSGTQTYHDGIDITARQGDPVRSAAEGKVIFAGQGPKEYGLTVIIYHAGRWTTTYSFLDKVSVKDGDRVRKGQEIGLAGKTGLASAPQLHFEVRRNRVAQDPLDFLPKPPPSAVPAKADAAR